MFNKIKDILFNVHSVLSLTQLVCFLLSIRITINHGNEVESVLYLIAGFILWGVSELIYIRETLHRVATIYFLDNLSETLKTIKESSKDENRTVN